MEEVVAPNYSLPEKLRQHGGLDDKVLKTYAERVRSMEKKERFYKYISNNGTVIYHRGNKWRGLGEDVRISKEEYVKYRIKQVEDVKYAVNLTEKEKEQIINDILDELEELGVDTKEILKNLLKQEMREELEKGNRIAPIFWLSMDEQGNPCGEGIYKPLTLKDIQNCIKELREEGIAKAHEPVSIQKINIIKDTSNAIFLSIFWDL
ncbi:hypothetical protein [Methanotorris igneus]|uniref:Uncharacterized protein n=1 Tax=Methanotorris igneus (strain DSM 5666 / JCM 11834 / Kol 5) TaxID=880724 RepID=F6BBZ0_METIK|nr:hypothetical protein [Methanotorris igneus]AEF96071.1 hypothetical protein Metig_0515 [Methanotorris igneus Kol 5]